MKLWSSKLFKRDLSRDGFFSEPITDREKVDQSYKKGKESSRDKSLSNSLLDQSFKPWVLDRLMDFKVAPFPEQATVRSSGL